MLDPAGHPFCPRYARRSAARAAAPPSARGSATPTRRPDRARAAPQPAPPAARREARAHATQRMSPHDVVALVGRQEQERAIFRRLGERRQQLQRRLVAPMQVVEEHHCRLTPGHTHERVVERRQGQTVDDPGRRAEFRQERSEFRQERSKMVREVPDRASARGAMRSYAWRAVTIGAYGDLPRSLTTPRRRSSAQSFTAA